MNDDRRKDDTRPKASPEQVKHLLKELKALAEGGHIEMTEFTLIQPPDKSKRPDLGGLSWEEWLEEGQRFAKRLEQAAEQIRQQRAATSSGPPSG